MMNLHKVLAIKPFQITPQIHEGYASVFATTFPSRPLRMFIILPSRGWFCLWIFVLLRST